MNVIPRLSVALMLTVGCTAEGLAQAVVTPRDLADASLEDLMNIEITSASRKEQRAEDVPAAAYVITREDIRRSGMTSVPDVLRLAPGVQVAQINSSKWAISVRGFNSLDSNKLLVLIDGRSIYNPLFAGVLWDTEDVMLEDVERIEVIRGPGAAVWGVNAVDGVINILTRSAADTTGLLVRSGVGTFDRSNLAVRYGGTAGRRGAYRAYTQLSMHGESVFVPEVAANDRWRSFIGGFRGDWVAGADGFTLQGAATIGQQRPLWVSFAPSAGGLVDTSGVSETQLGNVLARWTHTRANGATFQLQSFVDIAHRQEAIGRDRRSTVDVDGIYHTTLSARHDLVLGGGYRHIVDATGAAPGYRFVPSRLQDNLVNLFAQDEIALGRRVTVTLGAKFEHQGNANPSLQPTARMMWKLRPRQHLWAAVSQALRTPSLVEQGAIIDLPPAIMAGSPVPVAISVRGNPAFKNERLVSTEAGYRLDIGSRAAIDVAGFFGRYHHLSTNEPSDPTIIIMDGRPVAIVTTGYQNLLNADSTGVEITGRLAISPAWQADGTFSAFHLTPHPDPATRDPVAAVTDGDAPAYQWRGHSAMSFGPRLKADGLLFYVGALGRLAVFSYTRADVRLEWKLTRDLSVVGQGQNLFNRAHLEFAGNSSNIVTTQVPRSWGVRLTWGF